jgi:cell division protein FtsQ
MPRLRHSPRVLAPPRLPDRPGRWQLLWRRGRRLLRPSLLVVLVFLAAGAGWGGLAVPGRGGGIGGRLLAVTADLGLRVHQVVIEGRQKTPEPLLLAALGVHPGEPIFGFSLAAARRRIETINWVQSATVERRLPGTVVVRLAERRPFAVWQHDGHFVLIDRDGNTVTDSDVAAFAGQVPLVVGVGAPAAAAALLDTLSAYPELMHRLVAAVRVGNRRWNLRMQNGADVKLPEGAEAPAVAELARLQQRYRLLERPLAVIDLRLPDRLVVRPQPDGPGAPTAAGGNKTS